MINDEPVQLPPDIPEEVRLRYAQYKAHIASPAKQPTTPQLMRTNMPREALEAAWKSQRQKTVMPGVAADTDAYAVHPHLRDWRLIGISGLAGSGKTSAAHLIPGEGVRVIQFADPIYRMLSAMLQVDEHELRDPAKKNVPIPWLQATPRYLMQTLGTDWGRHIVRDTVWILAAQRTIQDMVDQGASVVVVADVRFNNEARWLRSIGGRVWHVSRPGVETFGHVSEAGISDDLIDVRISNDGNLTDLRERVANAYGQL